MGLMWSEYRAPRAPCQLKISGQSRLNFSSTGCSVVSAAADSNSIVDANYSSWKIHEETAAGSVMPYRHGIAADKTHSASWRYLYIYQ